jgi:hypothetical protein
MAAGEFDGIDPQALACGLARPLGLDGAVFGAEDVRGRNGWPDSQQTSKRAWRANISLIVVRAQLLWSGEQSWKRNFRAS